MTTAYSIIWVYLNVPNQLGICIIFCVLLLLKKTQNVVMNILEVTLVHRIIKEKFNVIFFLSCRGPSPSPVSSAPKIGKPLPAEALPSRPAAPEPPVRIPTAAEVTRLSAAASGARWQLSKPGLQARRDPPCTAAAPCARPQYLSAGGGAQEASTIPSPSQVSALGLERVEGGVEVWAALPCLRVRDWRHRKTY